MKIYSLYVFLFFLSYNINSQEGLQRSDSTVIICVENGKGVPITQIDLEPFQNGYFRDVHYNHDDCIEMIATEFPQHFEIPEFWFFLQQEISGINVEDLQLLKDHILGNINFSYLPELIAADGSRDKKISAADWMLILDLILGQKNDVFWKTLDKNTLNDSLNTASPDFTIDENNRNLDLILVKTADLNFSQFTGEIYDGKLRLKVEDQILNRGEYYSIPLILQNNTLLRSFQIEFSQNELLIDQFTYSHYNSPSSFTAPEDVFDDKMVLLNFSDQAQLLMQEDTFMTLNFRAMENGVLSEMLTFHSDVNNLATMSIGQPPREIVFDWIDLINTNVQEIELDKISLFPNPASQYLEIKGISSFMNYQINDLLGKVCAAGNLHDDTRLDLLNLNNGMYILTIKNSFGASKSFKFFVAK